MPIAIGVCLGIVCDALAQWWARARYRFRDTAEQYERFIDEMVGACYHASCSYWSCMNVVSFFSKVASNVVSVSLSHMVGSWGRELSCTFS